MQLIDLRKDIHDSTYLSDIFTCLGPDNDFLKVKRNKVRLSQEQEEFLGWLMSEKPKGLLIPVNVRKLPSGHVEEAYPRIKWPILDKVRWGSVLDRRVLNYFVARDISINIASAVGRIHGHGFVHRDLRPVNVFVNPNDLETKVFDYNTVSSPHVQEEPVHSHYETPPELTDSGLITYAYDVWQLGQIFRGLTHTYDFEGNAWKPKARTPDRALELISKAMRPDYKDRFSDCYEMHEALQKLP